MKSQQIMFEAIRDNPKRSFYLFPYANNSTEMIRSMVELLN